MEGRFVVRLRDKIIEKIFRNTGPRLKKIGIPRFGEKSVKILAEGFIESVGRDREHGQIALRISIAMDGTICCEIVAGADAP